MPKLESRTMPKPKPEKRALQRATKKLDPTKYRAVLAQAQLLDVKLTDVKFSVAPPYFVAEKAGDGAVRREVSFKAKNVSIDKGGAAIGVFHGSLAVRDPKNAKDALLMLSADYIVAFVSEDTSSEPELRAYVEQVGRLAAYPYFRQLVSSISNMAGAKLPTLPIIREWATVRRDQIVRKSN